MSANEKARPHLRHPVRTVAAIALVALCGVALTACGRDAGEVGTAAGSEGKKTLRVALIGPQSGQLAALGDWDFKGANLAAKEINANGGAGGLKIEITRMDDQGDPTTGGNLARKAVGQRVDVVFGSATSTVSLAMLPILTAAEIPQITSGQADALLEQGSSYIFLDGPTSSTYDATLAEYVVDKLGKRKIAMITNNGAYGKGEHDAFLAELEKRGVKPLADKVVPPDQKEFSGPLSEIRSSKPEILFIGAEEVQSGLIAKQARSLGIEATVAGGAPTGTPQYIETAGEKAAEGTIVSSPYLSNDLNEKTRAFADAYREAYGEEAELHGAKAYDGMQIVAKAVEQFQGKVDGPSLAKAMHSVTYSGLLGNFDYDEKGTGLDETRIGIVKNGRPEAAEGDGS
jgi:branched-chain amino acid transport system substrate-binding protein